MIKKILKKNVPELLNDNKFWSNSFLSITKHRLYSHYLNPCLDDNDVVLLLALKNGEIVGYMGVFVDYINIEKKNVKVGWLSTWWVHQKTKGSGIGRSLLFSIYESFKGRIGVSQFTPLAKRVYDRSGYFQTLQKNYGYKFVFRSNLDVVFPLINNKFNRVRGLLSFFDFILNIPINIKIVFHKINLKINKDIKLEYVNSIDKNLNDFIKKHSSNYLSKKNINFFNWLKAYHWVQESPLKSYTTYKDYFFSMNSEKFNIYFLKIYKLSELIGFLVLQRKDHQLKVLFVYYDKSYSNYISKIILLHCFKLKVKELICYDDQINIKIKHSFYFIYYRSRLKESIISKKFGDIDFSKYNINLGDGDCCFA